MAESNPAADSAAHHNIPGAAELQQEGVANYFQRRLAEDRGGEPPPAQVDSNEEQPDVDGLPDESIEAIADADIAEQPDEGIEAQDTEEVQPEDDAGPGIEIDGEYITADQIRELRNEASQGSMRLDDYTRKTQIISRIRQEHEALGTAFDEQNESLSAQRGILLEAVQGQLSQFENADTSKLTQEQFAQFQTAYANTRAGAERIQQAFSQAEERLTAARADAFQRRAKSTREMLRWHEPRWNQEFYGTLRRFAVDEGLMSEDMFNRETDFLRMAGLISLMDRANVDDLIQQKKTEKRPSKGTPRSQAQPRRRNARGQYQSAQQRVFESKNARRDGTLREAFQAKLAAEDNR